MAHPAVFFKGFFTVPMNPMKRTKTLHATITWVHAASFEKVVQEG